MRAYFAVYGPGRPPCPLPGHAAAPLLLAELLVLLLTVLAGCDSVAEPPTAFSHDATVGLLVARPPTS